MARTRTPRNQLKMTRPHGGSAGGRSQGARKRKVIAGANVETAQVEKERDELKLGSNEKIHDFGGQISLKFHDHEFLG